MVVTHGEVMKEDKMASFLSSLRIRKGYSLTELARKAELSQSYLSRLENSIKIDPSARVIISISEALETDPKFFLQAMGAKAVPVDLIELLLCAEVQPIQIYGQTLTAEKAERLARLIELYLNCEIN